MVPDDNWIPQFRPVLELTPNMATDITFCFLPFNLDLLKRKPDHFITTFEQFNHSNSCVCIFFLIRTTEVPGFFQFLSSLAPLRLTAMYLQFRSLPAGEYVYFYHVYGLVLFFNRPIFFYYDFFSPVSYIFI
jgi:hypothetical protein